MFRKTFENQVLRDQVIQKQYFFNNETSKTWLLHRQVQLTIFTPTYKIRFPPFSIRGKILVSDSCTTQRCGGICSSFDCSPELGSGPELESQQPPVPTLGLLSVPLLTNVYMGKNTVSCLTYIISGSLNSPLLLLFLIMKFQFYLSVIRTFQFTFTVFLPCRTTVMKLLLMRPHFQKCQREMLIGPVRVIYVIRYHCILFIFLQGQLGSFVKKEKYHTFKI